VSELDNNLLKNDTQYDFSPFPHFDMEELYDKAAMRGQSTDAVWDEETGQYYRQTTPPHNEMQLALDGLTVEDIQTVDYSEPVYFVGGGSVEMGEVREKYQLNEDGTMANRSGWMTESELREQWDAKEGMGAFKKANPSLTFDGYMNMLKDGTQRWHAGGGTVDQDSFYAQLAADHGVQTVWQNSDGDVFNFSGGGYVKSHKVDDHAGPGDYMKMAMAAAIGGVAGPAIGGALASSGMSAGLAKGVGAGIANIGGQLVTGGDIDPKSVIASGLMAGFNPGGKLTEYLSNKGLGVVPNNFSGEFVRGATNTAIRDMIVNGDLDVKDILTQGVIQGGIASVKDFFDDNKFYSIEQQMKKIQDANPDLSEAELFERALEMEGTGVSDLGGLVGEGGLLPFIDKVPTTWFNKLIGGGSFDANSIFIGPDGKEYTDTELLAIEGAPDPRDIWSATALGGDLDGWTHGTVTLENTALGDLWESAKDVLPGLQNASDVFNDSMDALARAQFKDKYGFDPVENPEAARDVFLYGEIDEVYSFSDNPRGQAEVIGQLQELEDKYSTGPDWQQQFSDDATPLYKIIKYVQDSSAAGETSSNIIASLGEIANQVLPGFDTTIGDAISDGFFEGITTPDSDDDTIELGGEEEIDASLGNEFDDPQLAPPPVLPSDDIDDVPPELPGDVPPELPPELPPQDDDNRIVLGDVPPELPPELGPPPSSTPVLPGAEPTLPGMFGQSGGDYTPDWGELFGYTTLTPYQKKALKPYKDYIKDAKEQLS
jgi:hypothetical protein